MSALVDRRRVLFGLAASTSIAAPIAVAAASPVIENAELMRLDSKFRYAYAAYLVAQDHKLAARARFEAIRPELPPEIIHDGGRIGRGLTEPETDCEGKVVHPADLRKRQRRIYTSDAIFRAHGRWFGKPECGDFRALHDATKMYEDAVGHAREASGIDEALEAQYRTVDAMRRLFYDIVGQEARTFAGIMVKANALVCYSSAGHEEAFYAKGAMGGRLADDVLAVFGGGAQS